MSINLIILRTCNFYKIKDKGTQLIPSDIKQRALVLHRMREVRGYEGKTDGKTKKPGVDVTVFANNKIFSSYLCCMVA